MPDSAVHRAIRGGLVLLLSLISGSAAPAAPQESAPSIGATRPSSRAEPFTVVVGRVVGRARTPVAGVAVAIHALEGEPLRAVTGADGRFRIESRIRGGGLWVASVRTLSADGFAAEGTIHPARILDWLGMNPEGGTLDVGTLALRPAERRRVSITSDGRPAAGMRVMLWHYESLFDAAVTDAFGVATFEGIVTSGYEPYFICHAQSQDGRSADAPLDFSKPQERPFVIDIQPRRPFLVHAVDAVTGNPVARAAVVVAEQREPNSWWDVGPAEKTDASGTLRVDGPPGSNALKLWVRAAGYRDQYDVPVLGGQAEVTLRLTRKEAQHRKLQDDLARQPPDGTEITIYSVDDGKMIDPVRGRIEGSELIVPWDRDDGRLNRVHAGAVLQGWGHLESLVSFVPFVVKSAVASL